MHKVEYWGFLLKAEGQQNKAHDYKQQEVEAHDRALEPAREIPQ